MLDYKTVDNNRTIAALLAEATSHIGTPYVWGGASSDGLDCSGLIYHSFREAFGITLGRTTYDMQHEGEPVRFDDLLPGDLLFFDRAGDVYHVALYLGTGSTCTHRRPARTSRWLAWTSWRQASRAASWRCVR